MLRRGQLGLAAHVHSEVFQTQENVRARGTPSFGAGQQEWPSLQGTGTEGRDTGQQSGVKVRGFRAGQRDPNPHFAKRLLPLLSPCPLTENNPLKCPSPPREREQPPPGHHRAVTHSEAKGGRAPPTLRQAPLGSSESACGRNTVQKRGSHCFTPSHQPSPLLPSSWFRRDLGAWPAPRPHPSTGFSARMQ